MILNKIAMIEKYVVSSASIAPYTAQSSSLVSVCNMCTFSNTIPPDDASCGDETCVRGQYLV